MAVALFKSRKKLAAAKGLTSEHVEDEDQEEEDVRDGAQAAHEADDDHGKLFDLQKKRAIGEVKTQPQRWVNLGPEFHLAHEFEETHEAEEAKEGDVNAGDGDPANQDKPTVEVVPAGSGSHPNNGE